MVSSELQTMWNKIPLCLCISTVICGFAQQSKWWNDDWKIRFTVEVDNAPQRAQIETTSCIIPVTEAMKKDGSDIRVVDSKGKILPHCIYPTVAQDAIIVAFKNAVKGKFHIYAGNQNPPALNKEEVFEPNAGLILEVATRPEGLPGKWDDANRMLDKRKVLLRMPHQTMSLSVSPIRLERGGIIKLVGFVHCPEGGEYEFGTNSFDASFLFVDDKMACQWPGWHSVEWNPERQLRHTGKMVLEKGIHKITYVNIYRNRVGFAAGWRRPGEPRMHPFHPGEFVRPIVAQIKLVESNDGKPIAAFTSRMIDDLGVDDRLAIRYSFTMIPTAKRPTAIRWSFGDGTTSEKPEPAHVYFRQGQITATLSLKFGNQTVEGAQTVFVNPNYFQDSRGYERRLQEYQAITAAYDFQSLDSDSIVNALPVLSDAEAWQLAKGALKELCARVIKFPGRPFLQGIGPLIEEYAFKTPEPDVVIAFADWLSQATNESDLKLLASATKALMLSEFKGDPKQSIQILEEMISKNRKAPTDMLRACHVFLAYAHLWNDDKKAAMDTVEKLVKDKDLRKSFGDYEITKGNHYASFLYYMRELEWKAAKKELDSWDWEDPTQITRGFTRHLRAMLYQKMAKYEQAARYYELAVKIASDTTFLPESLYGLAECQLKLDKKDEARKNLQRIIDEFPEATCSEQAKKMLEQIK